jgi:hypothetical protein
LFQFFRFSESLSRNIKKHEKSRFSLLLVYSDKIQNGGVVLMLEPAHLAVFLAPKHENYDPFRFLQKLEKIRIFCWDPEKWKVGAIKIYFQRMIDDARDHVMKYVLIARSLCRAGPIEECLLFDQIFIEASPTSTEDQHQDSDEECMFRWWTCRSIN